MNLCYFCPQVATLSSQMPEWRTVPSSSAMMDSVTCVVTHALRSCRSHAPATSFTDLTPSGWPLPRWHRLCLVQRSGGWRLTFTTKMVGTQTNFHAYDGRICVGVNLVNVYWLWSAGNIGKQHAWAIQMCLLIDSYMHVFGIFSTIIIINLVIKI